LTRLIKNPVYIVTTGFLRGDCPLSGGMEAAPPCVSHKIAGIPKRHFNVNFRQHRNFTTGFLRDACPLSGGLEAAPPCVSHKIAGIPKRHFNVNFHQHKNFTTGFLRDDCPLSGGMEAAPPTSSPTFPKFFVIFRQPVFGEKGAYYIMRRRRCAGA
jgi:hypothetical protein